MSKQPLEYLKHILDECNFILSVTNTNLSKNEFLDNEILKRAIVPRHRGHVHLLRAHGLQHVRRLHHLQHDARSAPARAQGQGDAGRRTAVPNGRQTRIS